MSLFQTAENAFQALPEAIRSLIQAAPDLYSAGQIVKEHMESQYF